MTNQSDETFYRSGLDAAADEAFFSTLLSTDSPPHYFANYKYDYPGSNEYTQDADYVKYGEQRWFVPGTVVLDAERVAEQQ